MTRSVYTLCGYQNLKPVGFCVVCAFCGNYKQRKYKYKSLSPINSNLHFYHSKYQMNLITIRRFSCFSFSCVSKGQLCIKPSYLTFITN